MSDNAVGGAAIVGFVHPGRGDDERRRAITAAQAIVQEIDLLDHTVSGQTPQAARQRGFLGIPRCRAFTSAIDGVSRRWGRKHKPDNFAEA